MKNECINKKFQECNMNNFFDEEHNLRNLFFGKFS